MAKKIYIVQGSEGLDTPWQVAAFTTLKGALNCVAALDDWFKKNPSPLYGEIHTNGVLDHDKMMRFVCPLDFEASMRREPVWGSVWWPDYEILTCDLLTMAEFRKLGRRKLKHPVL